MRQAALVYVLLAVVLTGVVALAAHEAGATPTLEFGGASVVGGWCRFDCGWYVDIADNGYFFRELPPNPQPSDQSSVAFFPGYPLAVRAMAHVIGATPFAAVVVTWLTGLAAVLLFAQWCALHLDRHRARIAVACLVLFPYAWYLFGAGYGDALFLAAAISAFVLLEHDHPLLAGVMGAVATASRPVGIAVAIGLLLRALEQRGTRFDLRALHGRDLGVLIAPAGLIAWTVWLWSRFNEPFAYASVQAAWDQKPGPHTWFKVGFFGQVLHGSDAGYRASLVLQAILTLAALFGVYLTARRFGFAYAAYTGLVIVAAAVGSKDFQGMGRYLLAAFPLFALSGDLIANRPRLRTGVLVASAALLVFGTFGFGRGWFLA